MTNEELKAENASLRAEVDGLVDYLRIASEVGIKIADDNLRLKAEVERLRKAGDAMAEFDVCVGYSGDFSYLVSYWNAAKDGKPSA